MNNHPIIFKGNKKMVSLSKKYCINQLAYIINVAGFKIDYCSLNKIVESMGCFSKNNSIIGIIRKVEWGNL
jgi:hypothetical protein